MALTQNTKSLQAFLISAGKQQSRAKGQVIQTTGAQKNINLIKAGYIKRYLITNDGSLGIEAIYGPGDLFSMTLVYKILFDQTIYDGPEVYYFEAMSDCELYSLNVELLAELIEDNPLLYRDLMVEAGKRMHLSIQGLENITMKSAYARTAHQLLYYAKQFGHKRAGGTEIGIPLTHQDIADVLSLTRETVSVTFKQLREKKLIKTGRYICIPSLEKLQEEAYS